MTPKFKVLADKSDITDLLNGRLLSLSIMDETGIVSDSMTMDLDNRDGVFEIPPSGAEIEVLLGYSNTELYSMGKFIVDEIELKSPPETISITARASNSSFRDIGAFKSPRSQSWEKQTITSIAQTIAKRYGLKATVAEEFKSVMIDHIDQADESDCAFIQRLASENDASIKIAGGTLLFIQPLSGKFPDGAPLPSITIKATDIGSYKLRIAERGKYRKVIAKYYDFDAAEEQKAEVGKGIPAFTLREVFTSRTIALSRAKTKLLETTTGTKTLSLDTVGNMLIGAESKIDLADARTEIAGEWIVKSAKHTLDSSGYKTIIEAQRKSE